MVQAWMKDFFLLREPRLSLRFVFHTSEFLLKVLSAKESQVRMCLQIKIYHSTKQHGKSHLYLGLKITVNCFNSPLDLLASCYYFYYVLLLLF